MIVKTEEKPLYNIWKINNLKYTAVVCSYISPSMIVIEMVLLNSFWELQNPGSMIIVYVYTIYIHSWT